MEPKSKDAIIKDLTAKIERLEAVVEKARNVVMWLRKRPVPLWDIPYLYSNIEELQQALSTLAEGEE
jgi:hypothetical protein